MIAVVIGATGGIGAALVRRLRKTPGVKRVVATWHASEPAVQIGAEPGNACLVWMPLDATDAESVDDFARQLVATELTSDDADSAPYIGLVVNAVGLLHNADMQPEKSLRSFKSVHLATAMQVNCLPTLLLAQALGPALKSNRPAVFASVSARVGSIGDNRLGGWYSYRISKAALNMAIRTLAVEWRRTHPNVCVAALHPGTTDTALSEPFQKNVPAGKLFDTDTTADYLLQVVSRLDASKSGRFWAYDGHEIPW